MRSWPIRISQIGEKKETKKKKLDDFHLAHQAIEALKVITLRTARSMLPPRLWGRMISSSATLQVWSIHRPVPAPEPCPAQCSCASLGAPTALSRRNIGL